VTSRVLGTVHVSPVGLSQVHAQVAGAAENPVLPRNCWVGYAAVHPGSPAEGPS